MRSSSCWSGGVTLMTWLSDPSESSADWTITWPMSLCNFPIAMASEGRKEEHHFESFFTSTVVVLKTLYLWHSGTQWWHYLEDSRKRQTSRIYCSLLDLQILPRILQGRPEFLYEENQSRINRFNRKQTHRDMSSDPPAPPPPDERTGEGWTSLFCATPVLAELWREQRRVVNKDSSSTDRQKLLYLVNSNRASIRGWWTTILFFSIRAVYRMMVSIPNWDTTSEEEQTRVSSEQFPGLQNWIWTNKSSRRRVHKCDKDGDFLTTWS